METVAVIGKVDCHVFCHINPLEDKMSNTAASIQPNPFWFWEKYHCFFMCFPPLLVSKSAKVLKSGCVKVIVRNGHVNIVIQLMK